MKELQPFVPDYGTTLLFVPGDKAYERLKKTDPKKLERLMASERKFYVKTHQPGYNEVRQERINQLKAQQKQGPDYQLLGLDTITEPITKRLVKNAYRRKARKLHPDVGGNEEAFKQLQDAYHRVLAASPKE